MEKENGDVEAYVNVSRKVVERIIIGRDGSMRQCIAQLCSVRVVIERPINDCEPSRVRITGRDEGQVEECKRVVESIARGGLLFINERELPNIKFLSEVEKFTGVVCKSIRPTQETLALLLLSDDPSAIQQAKMLIRESPILRCIGSVDVPSDQIKFVIGKKGATLRCLERACGIKIDIPSPTTTTNNTDPVSVMIRGADEDHVKEGKKLVLSAAYGGVLYADTDKVGEDVLREVERKAGVTIKMRDCPDSFGVLVLIIGDNKRAVQKGRTLMLDRVHGFHTATNLGRKRHHREERQKKKKEDTYVARKCKGMRKGDASPLPQDIKVNFVTW